MAEFIEMDLGALLNKGTLPDPVMYQYYKELNNNTIIINDEITGIIENCAREIAVTLK